MPVVNRLGDVGKARSGEAFRPRLGVSDDEVDGVRDALRDDCIATARSRATKAVSRSAKARACSASRCSNARNACNFSSSAASLDVDLDVVLQKEGDETLCIETTANGKMRNF